VIFEITAFELILDHAQTGTWPLRGRRSQLNFLLAEYHGMIGEGYAVLRGRRSS
jgi:hypothetical protein